MQHRKIAFAMLCTMIALGFAASEATANTDGQWLYGSVRIRTRFGSGVALFELIANPNTGELSFITAYGFDVGLICYGAHFIYGATGLSGICSNAEGYVKYFGQYLRYPGGIAWGNFAFTLYNYPGLGLVSGAGYGYYAPD